MTPFEFSKHRLENSFILRFFTINLIFGSLNIRVKQYEIMGLIKESLNIDLVINSNANAQELERIDLMIQQIKMRNKPLARRMKLRKSWFNFYQLCFMSHFRVAFFKSKP